MLNHVQRFRSSPAMSSSQIQWRVQTNLPNFAQLLHRNKLQTVKTQLSSDTLLPQGLKY